LAQSGTVAVHRRNSRGTLIEPVPNGRIASAILDASEISRLTHQFLPAVLKTEHLCRTTASPWDAAHMAVQVGGQSEFA
jgi:hypothetical protein